MYILYSFWDFWIFTMQEESYLITENPSNRKYFNRKCLTLLGPIGEIGSEYPSPVYRGNGPS
jgi:hypothetical protein